MWSIPNSDILHKNKNEAPGRIIHAYVYIILAEIFQSYCFSKNIFPYVFKCMLYITMCDFIKIISVSFNLQICVSYH